MPVDSKKYPLPRVRHHVSPQSYLPAGEHSTRLAWYPPTIDSANWANVFGNARQPDVLDIGCGRGGFLLEHALANPSINILGVEVRHVLTDWIEGVINGENLQNARALWYTVANGLQWIAPESIRYATYLFPDPWPKKRHYKRRLFGEQFLADVHRVLQPGGVLYLASDVPEVNDYQKGIIKESALFSLHECSDSDPWPFAFVTDQQEFCDRKGIPYWQYYARRR